MHCTPEQACPLFRACLVMILQEGISMNLEIRQYTKDCIGDVLDFERRLRQEEDFWGWEIDDE